MELTINQEKGRKLAVEKYKTRDKFVTLAGYAGTGKSTLVRFIIESLDVKEEDVVYTAFTGKAAEVLKKKGNKNAMTLHKLLYESRPKSDGGFYNVPKTKINYKVVVVDEVSMAPKSVLDLLLRHRAFCIFLGDPFQLPQIQKDDAHTYLDHPDIFLDQVMRQAQESEIIQVTMAVREGRPLEYMRGKDVIIMPKEDLVTGHLTWADIILCATNKMRHSLNLQKRGLLGFSGNISEGEDIIIKQNYWNIVDQDGNPLVNGTIVKAINVFESFVQIPFFIKTQKRNIPVYHCDLLAENGNIYPGVDLDASFLTTEEFGIDWKTSYQLGKMKNFAMPLAGTYGQALTVHSAQGSEWDKVLVLEESFPFDKIEHARWVYTAATRAASRLVLLR